MIQITLKAGERLPISATTRYLVMRYAGANIFLAARGQGEVQLKTSDVVDLESTNDIEFINKSATDQDIHYQLSPFKIDLSASNTAIAMSGGVLDTITNPVDVIINQGITIGAVDQSGLWNVSVNNLPADQGVSQIGSWSMTVDALPAVDVKQADTATHLPRVKLLPGVATLIAAADATRKELRLNIDSEQPGGVFLGKAGILANQGGFMDVGVTEYLSTEGALYAFNPNATDVYVSVLSMERV